MTSKNIINILCKLKGFIKKIIQLLLLENIREEKKILKRKEDSR
jgi:hypothetical protein